MPLRLVLRMGRRSFHVGLISNNWPASRFVVPTGIDSRFVPKRDAFFQQRAMEAWRYRSEFGTYPRGARNKNRGEHHAPISRLQSFLALGNCGSRSECVDSSNGNGLGRQLHCRPVDHDRFRHSFVSDHFVGDAIIVATDELDRQFAATVAKRNFDRCSATAGHPIAGSPSASSIAQWLGKCGPTSSGKLARANHGPNGTTERCGHTGSAVGQLCPCIIAGQLPSRRRRPTPISSRRPRSITFR